MKSILTDMLRKAVCFTYALFLIQTFIPQTDGAGDSTDSNGIDLQLRLSQPTLISSARVRTDQTQVGNEFVQDQQGSNNGLNENAQIQARKAIRRTRDRDRKRRLRKAMKESEPDVLQQYLKKERGYCKVFRMRRKSNPEAYAAHLEKQREHRQKRKDEQEKDPKAKELALIKSQSEEINPDIWLNLSSYSKQDSVNHSRPPKERNYPEKPQKELNDTATSKIMAPTDKQELKKGQSRIVRAKFTEEEKRERKRLSNRRTEAKHKQALIEKGPEAVEAARAQQRARASCKAKGVQEEISSQNKARSTTIIFIEGNLVERIVEFTDIRRRKDEEVNPDIWLNLSSYERSGSVHNSNAQNFVEDTATSRRAPELLETVASKEVELKAQSVTKKRKRLKKNQQFPLETDPKERERNRKRQKGYWKTYVESLTSDPKKLESRRQNVDENRRRSEAKLRLDPERLSKFKEPESEELDIHSMKAGQPQFGSEKDGGDQIIKMKTYLRTQRARFKPRRYDSFVKISTENDESMQEKKADVLEQQPPRKRLRNEKQLQSHREQMLFYRKIRIADPKRESEYRQKRSKDKKERLLRIHRDPIALAKESENGKIDLTLRLGLPSTPQAADSGSHINTNEATRISATDIIAREKREKYLLGKRISNQRAKQALIEKGPEAVAAFKLKSQNNWKNYKARNAADPERSKARHEKLREYKSNASLRIRKDPKRLFKEKERWRKNSRNYYHRKILKNDQIIAE
ncbi:uncharacterized protein FA14DRAFT_184846 [Meira miltonrushii]|uniref:Trichohyalin n=1 Tax=Meira miltonrushii TaxID=1280837 RepID=A0A316VF03_9BASI|nr:uncharacterized protein FA14DRAFT_184846 [Meira miltonrushii]PWN36162.1 hypothetical protein FA14DRAFT_184846 [Meira miltonrushii]